MRVKNYSGSLSKAIVKITEIGTARSTPMESEYQSSHQHTNEDKERTHTKCLIHDNRRKNVIFRLINECIMIATRSHAFHHPAINVTRTAIIIQINGHIYGMKFK